MGIYTVTSLFDDGNAGELRASINSANLNPGSTINFGTLFGTITLTSALPSITTSMIIDGTTASITISGANAYRPFFINASGSTVIISALTIQNGYNQDSLFGGGILVTAGSLTLNNCTLSGNNASNGSAMPPEYGGAGLANYGTTAINNCTFINNTLLYGTGRGGAIYNYFGTVSATNSTFYGNNGRNYGGAVYAVHGYNSFVNCTIYGNAPDAIYLDGYTASLTNCIIYNNTTELLKGSATYIVYYSCVQGGYTGMGNISGDPLLGALENNGGLTQTMALQPGSPCIWSGIAFGAPSTDQRGFTRHNPPSMGSWDTAYQPFILSLFNPLNWISNPITIPGLGDLFERRLGYAVAQVTLDTTPPASQILINEDLSSGGINVHWFQAYSSVSPYTAISSQDYVLDSLGNTVRAANPYGGAANSSQFEVIGSGLSRSVVKYLANSPTVVAIQIGCTSATPKSYVIEIQPSINSPWVPIIYNYSSPITLDFFQYVLNAAQTIFAIRLRYTGDYYTSSGLGSLTVSSQDSLTGTASIRISHYPDFRDASSFPGANSNGWLPFVDGSTLFNNYPLVNSSALWNQQTGTASTGLNNIINTSNGIFGITSNSVYFFNFTTGVLNTTPLYTAPNGVTITSYTVYQTIPYFGLSNGQIIAGNTFLSINTPFTNPITSLCSFQNELWIGTSVLSPQNTTIGAIYSWNGTSFSLETQVTQPQITSLFAYGSFMYAGTGGILGQASVYSFNSVTSIWLLSFSPSAPENQVDNIAFSTELSMLVVAFSGGAIYTNNASATTGLSTTWTQIYNGTQNFYDIVDDTLDGLYLFVPGSISLQVYTITSGTNPIFVTIPYPSSSVTINDVAYTSNGLYGVGSDGNIYLLQPINLKILTSNKRRIYLETQDQAGNTSLSSFTGTSADDVYMGITLDDIVLGAQTVNGLSVASGVIHQVNAETASPQEIATFTSAVPATLYAPNREVIETGVYTSTQFYVSTLSVWNTLSLLVTLPAGGLPASAGLTSGVEVDLYVRSSDSPTDLNNAPWVEVSTYSPMSNIGNSYAATTVANYTYSLVSFQGQWIQFQLVLSTATVSVTPVIQAITLSYSASESSFFYTTMFDTSKITTYNSNNPTPIAPYAQFIRGILTSNYILNNGTVAFGYTTDPTPGNTFNFTNFIEITPNTIFELKNWSQYIRFGVQLTSVSEPVIVDDIGVVMDVGPDNIFWLT